MENRKWEKTQIENLKNILSKMLKENGGKIDKDVMEVSRELDKLILQELKNKKK